jgi:hypothetical protein
MVDATKRNRELVADPPAQCPRLCKPQMVGVGRPPPAQQARLRCHELQVSAIAITPRFAQREPPMPTLGDPERGAVAVERGRKAPPPARSKNDDPSPT